MNVLYSHMLVARDRADTRIVRLTRDDSHTVDTKAFKFPLDKNAVKKQIESWRCAYLVLMYSDVSSESLFNSMYLPLQLHCRCVTVSIPQYDRNELKQFRLSSPNELVDGFMRERVQS